MPTKLLSKRGCEPAPSTSQAKAAFENAGPQQGGGTPPPSLATVSFLPTPTYTDNDDGRGDGSPEGRPPPPPPFLK